MQGLTHAKLDEITNLINRISYKPDTYQSEYRKIDELIPQISNFTNLILYFTEYSKPTRNYKLHDIYSSDCRFNSDYKKIIELKEKLWRVINIFVVWIGTAGWRANSSGLKPDLIPSSKEIGSLKKKFIDNVISLEEYAGSINYIYPNLNILKNCYYEKVANNHDLINAFIEITGSTYSNTNYLFYKLTKPNKHVEIIKDRIEKGLDTPSDFDYALSTTDLIIFPEIFVSNRKPNNKTNRSEKQHQTEPDIEKELIGSDLWGSLNEQ